MPTLVVLKVITEKHDNTTNNNSSDLDPEYWIKDTTIECNEGTGVQEALLISPTALVRFIKNLVSVCTRQSTPPAGVDGHGKGASR